MPVNDDHNNSDHDFVGGEFGDGYFDGCANHDDNIFDISNDYNGDDDGGDCGDDNGGDADVNDVEKTYQGYEHVGWWCWPGWHNL